MEKKPRILVVDGEPGVCRSCHSILVREGWEVDSVRSALEALKTLDKQDYDVIVSDMIMPKMSGMDLLKAVKEKTPQVSVIMITGYATIKTAVTALRLGAFDYIPKPFTPEELGSVTDRAIERRRLFAERSEPGEERPGDRCYLSDHAWAQVENDGAVRIGMDWVYLKTIGQMANIDLPFEEDEVEQGKVCVRITTPSKMRLHKLWAPVSGQVIEVNEEVNKDASLVDHDPYGRGWLFKVSPSNLEEDLKNLVYVDRNILGGKITKS
jgi:glycine cleavage system H lipoate-binding protein/ActR/RegA family two-component response regulator